MAAPSARPRAPGFGKASFHEVMLWVAAQTDGEAHAPRASITIGADGASRHSGPAASMTDPELDRSLQALVTFGRVAGRREARGSLVEWRALRLLPQGMVEVGAWPPEDSRHRLPTGCALWDRRDAPLLAHIVVRGPFGHVPCVPSDISFGGAQDVFPNVPVSRVDGYWSLMALRDGRSSPEPRRGIAAGGPSPRRATAPRWSAGCGDRALDSAARADLCCCQGRCRSPRT